MTKQPADQLSMSIIPASPKVSSLGEAEIDRAITLMFALPAREHEDAASEDILRQMFREAIIDVPAAALGIAIQRIARGALGHAFRPSPPELRILIDKIMAPQIEAAKMAALKRESEEELQREFAEPLVGGDLPATYDDIEAQIARLAKAMTKPKGYDVDDLRGEYHRALRGIKLAVLVEAVDRILDGRFERKVLTMPRVNEFAQLVRKVRDETEKAAQRSARSEGKFYRYRLPTSRVLEHAVTREYGRQLVAAGQYPKGCIWVPGPPENRDAGSLYAPDPNWQRPLPMNGGL